MMMKKTGKLAGRCRTVCAYVCIMRRRLVCHRQCRGSPAVQEADVYNNKTIDTAYNISADQFNAGQMQGCLLQPLIPRLNMVQMSAQ